MRKLKALFLGLMAVLMAGFTLGDEVIPNWPAPATWSPHSASRGVSTMGSITSPFPFIGVTPCRVVDTRNAVGPFGGPAFASAETRSYTIPAGPCPGIPVAAAYSLNFTVVGMTGVGFLTAWPAGTTRPVVSTLDYTPVEVAIANAAIVPTGSGGAISVYVALGTDVIIDINGYYASAGVGTHNTFLGASAGNFTMAGDNNTGLGAFALSSNAGGNSNTATGDGALQLNSAGTANTATGAFALQMNSGGSNNTAFGDGALQFSTGGNANIAIGTAAGSIYTTESSNICIGNSGVASDFGVIRVGSVQTKAFIAGVHGVTTGGTAIPVLIDTSGQLGTISSSARFKDEIQDMGETTEALLKLRPVTFRYKAHPEGRTQFGLIAEEVEKVMPELVACSSSGEAETVLYHEMPAMLLNELQKQQREIQELKSELSALRAAIGQK